MALSILPDFQEARITRASRAPIDDNVSESDLVDIYAGLDPFFISRFEHTKLPKRLLAEFVYALDHLDEMIKLKNFQTGRLLSTPDIINFGVEVTKIISSTDKMPFGVATHERVVENVQKFFDYGYLKTIHDILAQMKIPGIQVTLDGYQFFVGITYNIAHPRFGVLTYRGAVVGEERRVDTYLPFLLNRLK